MTVTHVAAFPLDFNLLCDWGQQVEIKFMKNDHFLVFLAV